MICGYDRHAGLKGTEFNSVCGIGVCPRPKIKPEKSGTDTNSEDGIGVNPLSSDKLSAAELSRRLRMGQAAVFTRIENDKVVLDMRTVDQDQVSQTFAAFRRVTV